jgi:hypothetical protein
LKFGERAKTLTTKATINETRKGSVDKEAALLAEIASLKAQLDALSFAESTATLPLLKSPKENVDGELIIELFSYLYSNVLIMHVYCIYRHSAKFSSRSSGRQRSSAQRDREGTHRADLLSRACRTIFRGAGSSITR